MHEIRSVNDGLHHRHRAQRNETVMTQPRWPARALPVGTTGREA